MRILEFEVNGQVLRRTNEAEKIVAGSKNYLVCNFKIADHDWIGKKMVAVFNNDAVAVKQNLCKVPESVENKKSFKVQLVGADERGERIVTNKVLIEQVI